MLPEIAPHPFPTTFAPPPWRCRRPSECFSILAVALLSLCGVGGHTSVLSSLDRSGVVERGYRRSLASVYGQRAMPPTEAAYHSPIHLPSAHVLIASRNVDPTAISKIRRFSRSIWLYYQRRDNLGMRYRFQDRQLGPAPQQLATADGHRGAK